MKTFESVIEAHRVAVGAEKLHVTLGPEATPDGLERELVALSRKVAAYNAFDEVEREAAKVARLKGVIRDIDRIAREGGDDALHRIMIHADVFADADIDVDTAWMSEQRVSKGLPMPQEQHTVAT